MKTAFASILALLATAPAFAQEAGYSRPHTSWGAPDLQGFWSNTSLTNLERPEGARLVVTPEEASTLARRNVLTRALLGDNEASSVDAETTKRILADKNTSRAYNQFWTDPGNSLGQVKGEYRTSWIVDPADGRIPYTQAGRDALSRNITYDGPEARPPSEQCLMSFTGGAGPVMTNGLYNNTYQIVQTPTSVMIMTEMIHEARIIPINDKAGGVHGPRAIPKWAGDSIGWYEGDTLVVETVNPHPRQRSYITATGKVTERFTRWSDGQILYQFTVEDPALYTAPWSGEMALNVSKQPPFEYACHEGNYSLPSILKGARQLERDHRPQQAIKQPYPGIDVTEGQ
ncbi:MAG TPA: hypothetical protein VG942_14085 [Hyphomonadaceae bacterium]|nr:hypothetical protein [Hyphomonadaceae bacterium]